MRVPTPIRHTATITLIAIVTAGTTAVAGQRDTQFGVDASVGYKYDSNVDIAALDSSSGEADSAMTIDLGLNGSVPLSDAVHVKLAYGYAATRYRDFAAYDLDLHQGTAGIGYRVGKVDAALELRRFAVLLDNDRFMDIRQVAPSVATLIGDRVYLRVAFTNADKHFADNAGRNAVNDALETDAYLLLDGMRHYLAFGWRADDEDAMNTALDYDGRRLKASWGRRVDGFARGIELTARLQYERRNYTGVTESLGIARRDERVRASLGAGIPLSDRFALEGEARYANTESNLPSADFAETVLAVSFSFEY